MFIVLILIFFLFLCVGSFLNVVAYRITFDKNFFKARSYCPKCECLIVWYDNIPIISWFVLKGKCRKCKAKISYLYPFIEITTALVMSVLFFKIFYLDPTLSINFGSDLFANVEIDQFVHSSFLDFSTKNILKFFSYIIFFGALIVSTRTDLEAMVIPQCFTLWLVPFGVLFSFLHFTNISGFESLIGAILGYGVLWAVAKVFKKLSGKDGLGEGDMELLALIGSFLGPMGVWFALMVASISGLLVGIITCWYYLSFVC